MRPAQLSSGKRGEFTRAIGAWCTLPATVGATTMTTTVDKPTLIAELVYEAEVRLGDRVRIGSSKRGERHLVPISGGTFEGPELRGEVLPGGADWQLTRPDGVLEVDARYTMRSHDGTMLHVRNRGIVCLPNPNTGQQLYVRTVPEFEAPNESPLAWMNRCIFLGTLVLRAPNCVAIGVYRVR
jgi:hypothetical protein